MAQLRDAAAVSAITLAEFYLGVLMAQGSAVRARRLHTLATIQNTFEPLPIDPEVSRTFAELVAEARGVILQNVRQESHMLSVDNRSLFNLASHLTYLNHRAFGATPKGVLAEKKRILDEIEKNTVEFLAYRMRAAWHQVAEKIARQFHPNAHSRFHRRDCRWWRPNALLRFARSSPGVLVFWSGGASH